MATSGSISTNSYQGRYVVLNWWRTSSNIAENYTNIHWELKGAGKASSSWYMAGNFKVVIDGQQRYFSSNRIKLYDGTLIASGDLTLWHDNLGNRSFGASIEAGIYTNAVNCNASGSWWLDNIPRYLNSCELYSKASYLNTLQVRWNCSPARDWTQYRLNDGNWIDAGDTVDSNQQSGWFNINNLNPNTNYKIQIRLRRRDSGLWSESNVIWMTTKNIATITEPNNNFNINNEDSLTVKVNNPSGNQIAYFLDCPSGTRRLTSGKTTNISYTWTKQQILSMLQYSPNNNSISVKVGAITYGNKEYYNVRTGTLNIVNSNPSFYNFTYEDTNSNTIQLTGNNQIIIKGYSNVKGIISTANKAKARNYARMSKYRFVIGDKQVDVNYSDNSIIQATINAAKNNIFTMYAIDSRGNSTSKQISPAQYVDYFPIKISKVDAIRENGIGSIVKLIFSGAIWEGSFGKVLNTIKSCQYRYKKTTSNTWIQGETILNPVVNGKTFSFESLIKGDLGANGFDINESYNVQVIISDKLSFSQYDYILGSGKPGIAITQNGVAINGMYKENLGGALQIWNGDVYLNGKKLNI